MLSLIHYIKPPDLLFRMCFMGAVRCFKRWLGQSKEPQENQASSSLNLPAEILETIWFTSASYCLCAHCQSLWCLLVPHNQTPGSASSQISIWHKYFLAASPCIFTSWISTPTQIDLHYPFTSWTQSNNYSLFTKWTVSTSVSSAGKNTQQKSL